MTSIRSIFSKLLPSPKKTVHLPDPIWLLVNEFLSQKDNRKTYPLLSTIGRRVGHAYKTELDENDPRFAITAVNKNLYFLTSKTGKSLKQEMHSFEGSREKFSMVTMPKVHKLLAESFHELQVQKNLKKTMERNYQKECLYWLCFILATCGIGISFIARFSATQSNFDSIRSDFWNARGTNNLPCTEFYKGSFYASYHYIPEKCILNQDMELIELCQTLCESVVKAAKNTRGSTYLAFYGLCLLMVGLTSGLLSLVDHSNQYYLRSPIEREIKKIEARQTNQFLVQQRLTLFQPQDQPHPADEKSTILRRTRRVSVREDDSSNEAQQTNRWSCVIL